MPENLICRREFIKLLGLGVYCGMAMPGISEMTLTQDRPNVIIILADDLGFGDLGCYNKGSKIPTPNIDRLADNGIRFTDAHSTSAVCTPSRYALLTGRYSWRTRLKKGVLSQFAPPLIETDRLTLPKLFKKRDYHTACIGKWHLGLGWQFKEGCSYDYQRRWHPAEQEKIDFSKPLAISPNDYGFDYFFGISCSNNTHPYSFIENRWLLEIPDHPKISIYDYESRGLAASNWDTQLTDTVLKNKAIEFINSHVKSKPEKPFLLYFSATAPHRPCVPPDTARGCSRAGLRGDMVCGLDSIVGQLTESLKENGIYENTLIIFSSDNGAEPGDPEYLLDSLVKKPLKTLSAPSYYKQGKSGIVSGFTATKGSWVTYNHRSNGDFKGYKTYIYEGGHRVPFIISWPAGILRQKTCNETISLIDLMASFAKLLDITLPENCAEDSYNVLPALLGHKYKSPIRGPLVHHSARGMFAIRKGQWKLVAGLGTGGSSLPVVTTPGANGPQGQLYDLKNDPAETRNLWLEHPDIVSELTQLLEAIVNGSACTKNGSLHG
jgi:arylsulfatase A-like enzyme